ncbi:MAG: dNTP triphosphohydrolase [Armatimonadetes bacterium]|nr:dNTP triphosphohydrolase [Armatimonadota bacterium]
MAENPREHRYFTGNPPEDNRSQFERDRDRVLHSGYFRRLSGVSQVASAADGDHFHNRLSHTLEVAQISRRMAEHLAKSSEVSKELLPNADVAETAALAHDLGHPPFGHVGGSAIEGFVNARTGGTDGFEGNAQSFRVVVRLTRREDDFGGLDLTRASLAAIVKYPWLGGSENALSIGKYGAYETEKEVYEDAMECVLGVANRSVEAEIMDWADDIAYSIHDVYDFYRAGKIPLARLARDPMEWAPIFERLKHEDPDALRNAAVELRDDLHLVPSTEFNGGASHRARMRQLSSYLISMFILKSTKLVDPSENNGDFLAIDERARLKVALLKKLVWHFVIEDQALAAQQVGQRQCLKKILAATWVDMKRERQIILPLSHRELLESGSPPGRVLADFLSNLTERQALALYRRLVGLQEGSIMDVITI